MKATATGSIFLDGIPVAGDELFGDDQAYHRQPAFSGGAWRFIAAQLGAAASMVDVMRTALVSARRTEDPHQRARVADATMAIETGRLWTTAAAVRAEDPSADAAETVSYVGMARLVVERACLDVITLAQRSVGLQALHESSPLERMARDLSTYLRQPVPDAIRDAAGASAFASPLPGLDRWMP
jgi:alkylation response protein AidB-like acyl-CoA dehydrogenase